MTYDVVVVGGGIGGLTVASLLSARGVNVCLLERQSLVGGCVARIQFAQHEFDPGFGIYSGWGDGEIHQRIFAELPVNPPEVFEVDSELVVRLVDRTDVRVYKDDAEFFGELQRAFPECSENAVTFYQKIRGAQSERAHDQKKSFFAKAVRALRTGGSSEFDKSVSDLGFDTSPRFKSFIDAQLRAFTGCSFEDSAFFPASVALSLPRQNLYAINGGPASLAERLAESISKSGGKVRFDSPVLRLAYDDNARAVGVDLLSGEQVLAKDAIISNLTVWDTYGKLVGLNRTPTDVKAKLSSMPGSGVYVLFASIEEAAVSRLPSPQMLFAPAWPNPDESSVFTFTASPSSNLIAPAGKRSVTISTPVEVNDWFTYQSSHEDLEEWDQAALEEMWNRLHAALPELGAGIEVIETANPRTLYDATRRKLGMVLGSGQTSIAQDYRTSVPNVFMVGDTVSASPTIASVSQAALDLVNRLTT